MPRRRTDKRTRREEHTTTLLKSNFDLATAFRSTRMISPAIERTGVLEFNNLVWARQSERAPRSGCFYLSGRYRPFPESSAPSAPRVPSESPLKWRRDSREGRSKCSNFLYYLLHRIIACMQRGRETSVKNSPCTSRTDSCPAYARQQPKTSAGKRNCHLLHPSRRIFVGHHDR